MRSKQDEINRLKKLTRETSLSRLSVQTKRADLHVFEVIRSEVAYLQWMCIMLLAGPDFRMTFKIHFKSKDSAFFAAPLFNVAPESLLQEQTVDFIREYCNLTTASLKRSLGTCGIDVGVSLPVVTRGYDELFFFADEVRANIDHWSIGTNERKLFASVLIEAGDQVDLSSLPEKPDDTETDNGDVEFL